MADLRGDVRKVRGHDLEAGLAFQLPGQLQHHIIGFLRGPGKVDFKSPLAAGRGWSAPLAVVDQDDLRSRAALAAKRPQLRLESTAAILEVPRFFHGEKEAHHVVSVNDERICHALCVPLQTGLWYIHAY